MIVSDEIFTPQAFLEYITGTCYELREDDTTNEILCLLKHNGYEKLRHYSFRDIETIVNNNAKVVLVDVSGFNENIWMQKYEWFEIPEKSIKNRKAD